MPALSDVCPEPATVAQLMAGMLERRTKNSFDLTCRSQDLSRQLVPPPLLHAEGISAGVCVGGRGGSRGASRASQAVQGSRVHSHTPRGPIAQHWGRVATRFLLCQAWGSLEPSRTCVSGVFKSANRTCVWTDRCIQLLGQWVPTVNC